MPVEKSTTAFKWCCSSVARSRLRIQQSPRNLTTLRNKKQSLCRLRKHAHQSYMSPNAPLQQQQFSPYSSNPDSSWIPILLHHAVAVNLTPSYTCRMTGSEQGSRQKKNTRLQKMLVCYWKLLVWLPVVYTRGTQYSKQKCWSQLVGREAPYVLSNCKGTDPNNGTSALSKYRFGFTQGLAHKHTWQHTNLSIRRQGREWVGSATRLSNIRAVNIKVLHLPESHIKQ